MNRICYDNKIITNNGEKLISLLEYDDKVLTYSGAYDVIENFSFFEYSGYMYKVFIEVNEIIHFQVATKQEILVKTKLTEDNYVVQWRTMDFIYKMPEKFEIAFPASYARKRAWFNPLFKQDKRFVYFPIKRIEKYYAQEVFLYQIKLKKSPNLAIKYAVLLIS